MRFFKAIAFFFKMLFDKAFYVQVTDAAEGKLCRPAQLLSLLQREGRFLDFLMEDISSFPDSQVGSVARAVHKGCRKDLLEYVSVGEIINSEEGKPVSIEKGFDPSAVRISGEIKGEPPFTGILNHHGWRITDIKLPVNTSKHDADVILPADVEVSA